MSPPLADEARSSEALRARRALSVGVLLFRWLALGWMIALALTAPNRFIHPWIAWGGLIAAGVWSLWVTIPRRLHAGTELWVELALAAALVVASGYVVPEGDVVRTQFYATAWPIAAVIAWGVARGPAGGLFAAAALVGGLVASRAVNGIAPSELEASHVQAIANASVTYLLAGVIVGMVSRTLDRTAEQFHRLLEDSIADRERAARLAERDSLARHIHDSVLQALAWIHKRGRELASSDRVEGRDVAALAETAARQEQELRALILREPSEPPSGTSSLRDALERTARAVESLPVSVSAVGPIWMRAHDAAELAAAAGQALQNIVEHARASRATIFADVDDGWVTVSVRDDGAGFVYDEDALRAAGKAGMLKSMKGRVEALGGRMSVTSAPDRGTEIELRVPMEVP